MTFLESTIQHLQINQIISSTSARQSTLIHVSSGVGQRIHHLETRNKHWPASSQFNRFGVTTLGQVFTHGLSAILHHWNCWISTLTDALRTHEAVEIVWPLAIYVWRDNLIYLHPSPMLYYLRMQASAYFWSLDGEFVDLPLRTHE